LDGFCRQHHKKLRGGGREPEAIDEQVTAKLARLLESGVAIEAAAARVGVARRTIYNWLERANEVDAPAVYVEFAERIQRSRDACEADLVSRVAREAKEDWRAAAWLLERLYPDRFARPSVRPAGGGKSAQPNTASTPDRDLPANVVPMPKANGGADW